MNRETPQDADPQAPVPSMPAAIVVTGAAGGVGAHFVRDILATSDLPVRALIHRTPLAADLTTPRVTQVTGSLLDASSLAACIVPDAAVVHLAWSGAAPPDEQERRVRTLVDVACRRGARRVVHCSTAVVVGDSDADIITEDTPCRPVTPYERAKYAGELAIREAASGRIPVTIVRPTAVFGPGLLNLVALIEQLARGSGIRNYLRACLYGRRNLHLVPVQTVVAALSFLAFGRDGGADVHDRSCYIVSSDHDPAGEFPAVAARIRRALGLNEGMPPLPVPEGLLRAALGWAGRSDRNPRRIYDGSRLMRAGFVPPIALGEAIDRYVEWYRREHLTREPA